MKLHGLMLAGAMLAMATNAHADGDPLKGEEFFRARCTPCHALERNVSKVGPSLLGVIDQSPASLRSFQHYSEAMKAFGAAGNKWDDVTLARFLTRPRSVVAETNMATAGIKDPQSVADVIAFLHYYSRQ